ncbi:MAG: T9SS type A sorting domain-containing protein [Bacteroidota bacterium]
MKKKLLLIASVLMGLCIYGQTTNMIWAENLYYPTTNGTSRPNDLVIDNAGNYYITGSFSGILDMDPGPGTHTVTSLGTYDIFIAKYTTNGNLIWVKSVGTNSDDAGNGLHVVNNKLYVVGAFQANSIDMDPGPGTYTLTGSGSGISSGFIATFDTSGTLQSAFSMPQCPVNSVKTDNSNNIYIGGQYRGSVDLDPGPGNYNKTSVVNASVSTWDLFYGKYSPTGSMIWANVKAGYMDDNANAISIDPITGNVAMAGLYDNLYIALTNASGAIINDANMGVGTVTDVVFDAVGNFYFTGNYSGVTDFDWSATASYSLPTTSSYAQAFVIKYNSSNTFSWAKQITSINPANTAQGPVINMDNNGNVLIIGRESNAGSNSWFYFAKIDPSSGSIIWRNNLTSSCYNGPSGNEGTAIAYNSLDGTVLVAGVIGGSSTGSSTPCSFDADPGSGVYTLMAGVGNADNRDVFMGKYATCLNAPTNLSTISGSTVQCSGSTATYSISPVSGASSYVWSIPSGWTGSSSTNTISTTVLSSGSISVAAVNSCGTSTAQTLAVQVNPVPAQPTSISGAVSLCNGSGTQTYSVPAVSGAISYSWSLPGSWSGTATTNTIQVSPGVSGGTLSVLAINGCGNSSSQSLNVTVNALPSVSINGATSLCVGNSINLSASGANTYTWSTSSNSNSISVSPTVNTSYNVTGTDANGCTNTATKNVTVNALPSVSINGATSLCTGSSINLSASGANTYTWSTSSNSNSISVSPTVNTSYTVTGTDVNGCTNIATKNVTVNALPSVSISGATSLCTGSSINLSASGANTYTWSTSSNSSSISVSPTVNTSYNVTGTDANGCTNIATKNVTVNALPSLSISATSTLLCIGESTTLSVVGATSYSWSTGSTNSSVIIAPTANTNYSVIGTDVNSCSNSAVITLSVSSCTGIESFNSEEMYINVYPNPTVSKISILSSSAIHKVILTDMSGKIVAELLELKAKKTDFDLESYGTGIYLLTIYTEDGIKRMKLIKE